MDVYDRIDERLKEQHMSRRKLAMQIGVPPSTFQSMMERKKGLTFDMLGEIVEALNTSLYSLYDTKEMELPDWLKKPQEVTINISAEQLKERPPVECTQDAEERISAALEKLNTTGQNVAVERVEELTKIPDYQK